VKTRAENSKSKEGSHGVQSAATVLEVLSAFVGAEQMPMLKTLAERTGMHPAKVHRYLVSLCRMGYVEQDATTSRYRLGPASLQLAFAAMTAIDSLRVARPMMADFCHRLRSSVVLAIWNTGGPAIAIKETMPGLLTVSLVEGTVLPILRSSIGRAFGAWLPRVKTKELIEAELSGMRKDPLQGCPTSWSQVEALFTEIRKRGLSRVTGQLSPQAHSLAAPVFDAAGQIEGVLCAVGPAGEFDSTWSGPTARTLLECASSISRGLGYVGSNEIAARL
jgi:DNA-binding IclR family transcriptional regulator